MAKFDAMKLLLWLISGLLIAYLSRRTSVDTDEIRLFLKTLPFWTGVYLFTAGLEMDARSWLRDRKALVRLSFGFGAGDFCSSGRDSNPEIGCPL